jgi:hypothetical protein
MRQLDRALSLDIGNKENGKDKRIYRFISMAGGA